ncbi:hypothetical protein M9458_043344, partial [Cirrhinus mrigala]
LTDFTDFHLHNFDLGTVSAVLISISFSTSSSLVSYSPSTPLTRFSSQGS